MDSHPIRQQDHPKVSPFHLVNFNPTTNSTIGLDVLSFRRFDDALNPLILDYRTIGTGSNGLEVFRHFHDTQSLSAYLQYSIIVPSTHNTIHYPAWARASFAKARSSTAMSSGTGALQCIFLPVTG